VRVVEAGPLRPTVAEAALVCRGWASRAITAGLESRPAAAAVVRAMVLGERDGTPPEVEEPFLRSGTMHLFAISGLHVAMFASLLWLGGRCFGLRRALAFWLLVPGVFFYAFVTGWRPSSLRAAVMLSLVFAGLAADRHPRLLNSLGAAVLVVLAWDSHQLFMPGFQLSFGVLLSIGLFSRPIEASLRRWTHPDPFLPHALLTGGQRRWFRVLRYLGASFAVTSAAWLGSLALVWSHFGLVTPVALLANLVMVPFAFVVLGLAAAAAGATGAGLGWLAVGFNRANGLVAGGLLAAAGWFADLPGAYLLTGALGGGGAACRVTLLDLGPGAAQLVEPAGGRAWLIDVGSPFDGRARTPDALAARGVQALGGVVLTHYDSAHVGGAPEVVNQLPARPPRVVAPAHAHRSPAVEALRDGGVPLSVAAGGEVIEIGPSARLEVLYPPPGREAAGLADDNVLVVRLVSEGWRVLFLGDAGFETEAALLASGADLRSDVLVKGSHATDRSGTGAFVAAVAPSAVVVTSAAFPDNERPDPSWLDGLRASGVAVFDQSETGAVTLQVSRDEMQLEAFLGGVAFTLRR
jgi:ComEC/Rec2-related protein